MDEPSEQLSADRVGSAGNSRLSASVLGVCLAAALAIALAGSIGLAGQTRTLQYAAYAVGFGMLLPLATALGSWRSVTVRWRAEMGAAASAAATAVVAMLCLMRLAGLAGMPRTAVSVLAALGGLAVAAGAVILPRVLASSGAGPSESGLRRLAAEHLPSLAVIAVALVVILFLPKEVSPVTLVVAIAIGAGGLLIPGKLPSANLPRWALVALNVAFLVAVALLVIDVTGYWGTDISLPGAADYPYGGFGASVQIHQHFFLGPVNDVLHGRALLVDANAVYGIGNTYLLALWFELVPLGYGTFALFGSLASLLVLILGWAIARAAGVSRAIASITIVLAAMVSVLAPPFPPSLFINLGGLRFAPPYVLLAVALLVHRDGRNLARSPWVLATFAFFSLWNIEAITYCAGAYVGLLAVDAVPAPTLRRGIAETARSVGSLLAACLLAYLIFGVLTLSLAGAWPDWGRYLALFRAWYDFVSAVFAGDVEAWSRGWLIGGIYVASSVGTVAFLRSAVTTRPSGRTTVASAGLAGAGIAFLSYFVAHSADVYLAYVSYPALLLCAIWLSNPGLRGAARARWRRAALAVGAFLAVLIVGGSWSAARPRLPYTALAHLIPGGPSLSEDLSQLWHSPPLRRDAQAAAVLIDRYFPAGKALVLIEPDLGQEALMRSDRANLLPISYPWQDELDLDRSLPPVAAAVNELEPGTPILLQSPPEPGAVSTPEQFYGNVPPGERLGPLAQAASDLIRERFGLKRVATGPDGLYVAYLKAGG